LVAVDDSRAVLFAVLMLDVAVGINLPRSHDVGPM